MSLHYVLIISAKLAEGITRVTDLLIGRTAGVGLKIVDAIYGTANPDRLMARHELLLRYISLKVMFLAMRRHDIGVRKSLLTGLLRDDVREPLINALAEEVVNRRARGASAFSLRWYVRATLLRAIAHSAFRAVDQLQRGRSK